MSYHRPAITKDFLSVNDSRVHYFRFGQGQELLICFHGFGDRGNMFLQLREALSSQFTVYALDLPYHGQTEWNHPLFRKQDFVQIIDALLKKESSTKFSLMGFSFGGRIVQSLLEEFEDQLLRLFLIAPDGIANRWMFSATLAPQWFRYLVRWGLRRPDWFIRVVGRLKRAGIVSPFIHDFTVNHISNEERRKRIFNTWLSFNNFKLTPSKTKNQLKQLGIPVYLFFGRRDEVIPLKAGEWLSEGLANAQLYILDEGHLLIDQKLNRMLKNLLKD